MLPIRASEILHRFCRINARKFLTRMPSSSSEVQDRLAGLNNDQLHQVALHLDGVQPGGELILILAIIGAVVVIMAIIGLARQA